MLKIIFANTLLLLIGISLWGNPVQPDTTRLNRLEEQLDRLVLRDSAFLSEIDISASRLPLSEVLRNVAKVNQVNLCVRDADQQLVSCNFKRIRISDLLLFLCREYRLDLEIVGNIVSVSPYTPVPAPAPEPHMEYDPGTKLFSCDFTQISLITVTRKIAQLTGLNIIVPQTLYATTVSGYINRIPVEEAMPTLGSINQLTVLPEGKSGWRFAGREEAATGAMQAYTYRPAFTSSQLEADSLGYISAAIMTGNLSDIITSVCEKLKLNYYFVTPVTRNISIFVHKVDLPSFFNVLFTGSEYSWYENDGIYLFSSTGKESSFITTRIVPMRYRTVNKITELIPEPLKRGMQVAVFPDLNSVILCGEQRGISRIEQFLQSLDKSVPLITIDVIIADVRKNVIREGGISAGLGNAPEKTSGKLSPGIDMKLNSSSVNKLINSFNGFGSINLGKVSPDFYVSLKLLEQSGNIELRSTPKLSTLNGHEAKLKSGETRHYKEVTSNIIGTQNPMQTDAYTWKSIEANLELTITPFVSQDSILTLTIHIVQTEFAEEAMDEKKETPPSTTTRSFESILRIKNGETVLLGGIERSTKNKTSAGVPVLSRIPVLKWLFGSAANNKTSQKLNIFIQPTIIF